MKKFLLWVLAFMAVLGSGAVLFYMIIADASTQISGVINSHLSFSLGGIVNQVNTMFGTNISIPSIPHLTNINILGFLFDPNPSIKEQIITFIIGIPLMVILVPWLSVKLFSRGKIYQE